MTTEPDELDRKIETCSKCETPEEYRAFRATFSPEEEAEWARRCKRNRTMNGIEEPETVAADAEAQAQTVRNRFWIQGLAGFAFLSLLIWGFSYLFFGPGSCIPLLYHLERPSTIDDAVLYFTAAMVLFGPLYWFHVRACWLSNCASLAPEKKREPTSVLVLLVFAAFMLALTGSLASDTNERLINDTIRETIARGAELQMSIDRADLEVDRPNDGAWWGFMVAAVLISLGGVVVSAVSQRTTPVICAAGYVFLCSISKAALVGLAAPVFLIPFLLWLGWTGMTAVSRLAVARI
jgi:hypothetical protein